MKRRDTHTHTHTHTHTYTQVLLLDYEKPRAVTLGNWESDTLSDLQLSCASLDAWVPLQALAYIETELGYNIHCHQCVCVCVCVCVCDKCIRGCYTESCRTTPGRNGRFTKALYKNLCMQC